MLIEKMPESGCKEMTIEGRKCVVRSFRSGCHVELATNSRVWTRAPKEWWAVQNMGYLIRQLEVWSRSVLDGKKA